MKVLLVEDEAKIAAFAKKGLTEAGFTVDHASNGDDGLELAITREYDALILDIMLPGRDGLSILNQLREHKYTVPVILLTARSALDERLDGLNRGADDYLTKPFYIEELIARLHALIRRASGQEQSVLSAGHVSVNLIDREVKVDGDPVELTAREYSLLTYLMRSPGRVLTRTQICEHVWDYHFDPGTNLVDVCVQRLRKKISIAGQDPLIETVRGVGYKLKKDA
ncbi:MAG: response regulator transcription factor [Limisphaerales bacterium]